MFGDYFEIVRLPDGSFLITTKNILLANDTLEFFYKLEEGGILYDFTTSIQANSVTSGIDLLRQFNFTTSIQASSVTADIDLINQQDFTTSIQASSVTADIDVIAGKIFTADINAVSVTSDIDLLRQSNFTTSINAISITSGIDLETILIIGSVCFGHLTDVEENNALDFTNHGNGTAVPSGSGDSEILTLIDGQYWEFNPINFGAGFCAIATQKYQSSSGSPVVKYRTSATQGGLSGESWLTYSEKFTSLGYVGVRLEYP